MTCLVPDRLAERKRFGTLAPDSTDPAVYCWKAFDEIEGLKSKVFIPTVFRPFPFIVSTLPGIIP